MTKMISVKNLRECGLLYKINREVLHPLGLALSIDVADDGTESFGDILLADDADGWIYNDESMDEGCKKLSEYMSAQGKDRIKSRLNSLGYIIQPETINPG
jgi:hypothetical protein